MTSNGVYILPLTLQGNNHHSGWKKIIKLELKLNVFFFKIKGKKGCGKRVAPAPAFARKAIVKKRTNPLFEKRAKNFGEFRSLLWGNFLNRVENDVYITRHLSEKLFCVEFVIWLDLGFSLLMWLVLSSCFNVGLSLLQVTTSIPRRDLTHFVRWPGYIQLQRQKVVLERGLKVPSISSTTPTGEWVLHQSCWLVCDVENINNEQPCLWYRCQNMMTFYFSDIWLRCLPYSVNSTEFWSKKPLKINYKFIWINLLVDLCCKFRAP